MVDLFMYRDPDTKKASAAEEGQALPDDEDKQGDDGAAVANTMKTYEGQDDEEEGEEDETTWGAGQATEYTK